MNEDYETGFQLALTQVEEAMILDAAEIDDVSIVFEKAEHLESDMDGWDFVACSFAAGVSTFLTTNEAFEKWLAEVHDAASSPSSNDRDFLQKILGVLFNHQGDAIDRFSNQEGDRYYVMFHRLLFGHDILSTKGGFAPDNPFAVMFRDKGTFGILQAVRHLIADTFSKQGLPLPLSSYLDYDKFDPLQNRKKPWNKLIDLVQELSLESYGNKGHAGEIYSHLLTIRAQDIAGGVASGAIASAYLSLRGITDEVRASQVKLVAYSMSFYAEAIAGAVKQKGVPYINAPLGCAMAKEFVALMVASNKKTFLLGHETKKLHNRKEDLVAQHNQIKDLLSDDYLLTD